MKTRERFTRVTLHRRDAAGVVTQVAYGSHDAYVAGQFVESRVQQAGEWETVLFGPTSLRGAMAIGNTTIVLRNEDGALDGLRNYSFDGLPVAVDQWDFEGGEPLTAAPGHLSATHVAEQVLVHLDRVEIVCRSGRHNWDVPLLTARYAGTNVGSPLAGIEGTADDIGGTPKPRCLGIVRNVAPVMVNTTRLIYQVDGYDGFNTGFTIGVYDKRASLARGADYASQAAMETTAPAAGQFRVWPAGGCFRLGSTPVGQVTCDVNNPSRHPVTGVPIASPSARLYDVAAALLYQVTGEQMTLKYLTTAVSTLTGGIYFRDEISLLTALEQVVGGFLGYMMTAVPLGDGDGTAPAPYIGQLHAPGAMLPWTRQVSAVQIDESVALEGVRLVPVVPEGSERGLPVYRVVMRHDRNYTVMTEMDLAGVVATSVIERCKTPWRVTAREDAATLTKWPEALETTIDTALLNVTFLDLEVLALLGGERRMYQLTGVPGYAIRSQAQFSGGAKPVAAFHAGCEVVLTLPRADMGAGKTFLATRVAFDFDSDTYSMTLWG